MNNCWPKSWDHYNQKLTFVNTKYYFSPLPLTVTFEPSGAQSVFWDSCWVLNGRGLATSRTRSRAISKIPRFYFQVHWHPRNCKTNSGYFFLWVVCFIIAVWCMMYDINLSFQYECGDRLNTQPTRYDFSCYTLSIGDVRPFPLQPFVVESPANLSYQEQNTGT